MRLTICAKAEGEVEPTMPDALPASLIEIFSAIGRRRYGKGARCEGEMSLVIYIARRNADARTEIVRTAAPQCRWDEIYWRAGRSRSGRKLSHRCGSKTTLGV